MQTFIETPKSARTNPVEHYTWCAEHEGRRTVLAIQNGNVNKAYHYARDAAHWASRVIAAKETH